VPVDRREKLLSTFSLAAHYRGYTKITYQNNQEPGKAVFPIA
jgi:hypothetical protein